MSIKSLNDLTTQFIDFALETEAALATLADLTPEQTAYYKGVCKTWRDAADSVKEFANQPAPKAILPIGHEWKRAADIYIGDVISGRGLGHAKVIEKSVTASRYVRITVAWESYGGTFDYLADDLVAVAATSQRAADGRE